jgi:Short C-terminal domain
MPFGSSRPTFEGRNPNHKEPAVPTPEEVREPIGSLDAGFNTTDEEESPSPPQDDVVVQLEALDRFRERGLLSEDEFQARKQIITSR